MEIDDPDVLARHLDEGGSLDGARLENLDLTTVQDRLLARTDLHGLVVLGGRVGPRLADHLTRAGAVVLPTDPQAPVDVYRSRLYTPAELYDGLDEGYGATPDARAYTWSRDAAAGADRYAAVLRALHDDSILDALDDALTTDALPAVGVMGGHAVQRGDDDYTLAARLGRALARGGRVVLTGGGPGAMEAANLGALAAAAPDDALDDALRTVAAVPSFAPDVTAWARAGLAARALLLPEVAPPGTRQTPRTLGIPTWFYGHEPPNVLVDGIAKLFSNALREDVLLARCNGGIVVLPGAAGTVQEIFQATTRLYYGQAPQPPLVLVGRDAWTRDVPAWPLLQALAAGRDLAASLHLVDTVDEAAAIVTA